MNFPISPKENGPTGDALDQQKRDHRQEVTDSIIKLLEQGVAPWQKPWQGSGIPMNPTTEKSYRGGNAVHLLATALERGYEDPRWMTYKQAAENDWQVKKGEKGTRIEFWEVKEGSNVEPESEGSKTELSQRQYIHRTYTVFNAHQIEGIPPHVPKQSSPFEMVEAGERILASSGANISHDQADHCFYNWVSDSIHLTPKESFQNASGYYGTALHELAHWTGHPSRLNRATLNESYRFGDPAYAREELRAELTSLFLAAETGIPHDPASHAAYVGSWVKALREDKHEIFRAAHDASKAVDFVLALERDISIADQELTSGPEAAATGTSRTEILQQDSLALHRDRDELGEEPILSQIAVPGETPSRGPALDGYRAEYPQVLQSEEQIEVSKMDKEARQFYVVSVPSKSFGQYLSGGVPLTEALPNLPDHKVEFLSTGLTPAEQRIVRDPAYQQAVDVLMKASPAAFQAERTAILNRSYSSQLEPYDYPLSLRHQAFNAALKQRPDINSSVRELDWIKEIAPAQYQAQVRRDPTFNPDKRASPAPAWTQEQLREQLESLQQLTQSRTGESTGSVKSTTAFEAQSENSRFTARYEPGSATVHVYDKQTATDRSSPVSTEMENSNGLSRATQAKVPTEAFQTESKEPFTGISSDAFREASALTSKLLGGETKTYRAQVESGLYGGPVIGETPDLFLQRLSPRSVIAHPKELFNNSPQIGSNISINYSHAKPTIREFQERGRALEMTR